MLKGKKCSDSSPNHVLLENSYRSFCSLLQKDIRSAKRLYYHRQFENYKYDMKKTWKKINELISNRNKSSEFPNFFLDGEQKLTENIDIANCFNIFFAAILVPILPNLFRVHLIKVVQTISNCLLLLF